MYFKRSLVDALAVYISTKWYTSKSLNVCLSSIESIYIKRLNQYTNSVAHLNLQNDLEKKRENI